MRLLTATCSFGAIAPGRPEQGPTLPEGRLPYPASEVRT